MKVLTCKICGGNFYHDKERYCKAKLKKHLNSVHNISLEDYLVKYYYNGIHPVCPCGCGKKLKLGKGWKFQKFATDKCFGKLVKEQNDLVKSYIDKQKQKTFDIKKYYELNYNKDTFEKAFKLFSTKEMPLGEVAKEYNIDKRTLKRIWLILNICTESELTELTEFYRYNFVVERKGFIEADSKNEYTWIFLVLKNNPQKYTINSIKNYYNEKNINKLNCHAFTLYKNLKKLYGDEIDAYLRHGIHSNEEYIFYNILCFYFSSLKNKIELGKKFETLENYIIYDFCIDNKLLIEYDSKGTYHNDKISLQKDKYKENFALEHNYKFLRLTKNDILDPITILKIKELIC